MNAAIQYRSDLRPLPMRVTQHQFERLQGARERDGLSVQEHVRRALDFYLDRLENVPQKVDQATDAAAAAAAVTEILSAISPVHPGGYTSRPRPKVRRK